MNDSASPAAARVALRPENIPQSLKVLHQWCVWKYEARATGKPAKHPYQPNGPSASSKDKATWATFEAALSAYQRGGYAGIGVFVADNLSGVDLDGCRDEAGANEAAAEILGKFAGSYTEISPSGAGYRILCLGKPQRSGKNTGKVKWVECYAEPSSRFLSVTGNAINSADVTEQQAALDWLHQRYFAGASQPAEPDATTRSSTRSSPPPVFTTLEDGDVIEKACRDAGFAALWAGDTSGYGGDASSADMSLAGKLVWWCNGDAAQVDRLFRLSGLYRDKWDSKRGDSTYGAQTVALAISNCRGGYSGGYSGQRPDTSGTPPDSGKGEHSGGGESSQGRAQKPVWITGEDLLRMTFPEPTWLLPDVLPEAGLFLLSGKPKAGKSWLVLALSMAVAQGGQCIGRRVPLGGVLVLALEDNLRRLKSRMVELQPDAEQRAGAFHNLAFRTIAPTIAAGLDKELKETLADLARRNICIRLVVVDTLQKVRGAGGASNGNQYALDYEAVSRLKAVADEACICLVVVHHLRKQEADDVHDMISGTQGIGGAADGSLVLVRQRGQDAAVLYVTGRDMPETELGLKFDGHCWTYAGTAAEVRASGEQNEVFEVLKRYGSDGATVKQICEETERKRRVISHHMGKLIDAKRVRVRHTKPAPHYAVCDGPLYDAASVTPPPTVYQKKKRG